MSTGAATKNRGGGAVPTEKLVPCANPTCPSPAKRHLPGSTTGAKCEKALANRARKSGGADPGAARAVGALPPSAPPVTGLASLPDGGDSLRVPLHSMSGEHPSPEGDPAPGSWVLTDAGSGFDPYVRTSSAVLTMTGPDTATARTVEGDEFHYEIETRATAETEGRFTFHGTSSDGESFVAELTISRSGTLEYVHDEGATPGEHGAYGEYAASIMNEAIEADEAREETGVDGTVTDALFVGSNGVWAQEAPAPEPVAEEPVSENPDAPNDPAMKADDAGQPSVPSVYRWKGWDRTYAKSIAALGVKRETADNGWNAGLRTREQFVECQAWSDRGWNPTFASKLMLKGVTEEEATAAWDAGNYRYRAIRAHAGK